ncbi:MAG: hypothetical protein JWM59_975 [Verrucomicrobiales bacterium]|nr:hypothetical protein [Verrucomicrobiales bacterium]
MSTAPIGWPKCWDGKNPCGYWKWEMLFCTLSLGDGHTPVHFENYSGIVARWDVLWPAAWEVIQSLIERFGRDIELDAAGNAVLISIPAKPIGMGVRWSIALENPDSPGVWDATFEGWWIRPEESQPYF